MLNEKGGRANGKTVLLAKYEAFTELKKFLAELKKKYTESCTDCGHFVGCEKAVWTGPCDELTKEEGADEHI